MIKFLKMLFFSNKLILRDGDYLFLVLHGDVSRSDMEELSRVIRLGFPELAPRIGLLFGDIEMKVIHEENK